MKTESFQFGREFLTARSISRKVTCPSSIADRCLPKNAQLPDHDLVALVVRARWEDGLVAGACVVAAHHQAHASMRRGAVAWLAALASLSRGCRAPSAELLRFMGGEPGGARQPQPAAAAAAPAAASGNAALRRFMQAGGGGETTSFLLDYKAQVNLYCAS
jgi:hypothetical protein